MRCLVGIFILFWIISNYLVPLSVEHGVNVAAAKYMVQGLMPYQAFDLSETPIGIGILSVLYRMVGIEASSYWGTGLMMGVHLLNGWLLWKLMVRMKIEKAFALFGLLFYGLLVYSSDGMMLNLEPMAVSFLLGASLLILQRTMPTLIMAGVGFALAVGCKAQAIALLPVLTAMMLWKGKDNQLRLEKGLLFVAISLVIVAAGFMGISMISEQANWTDGLFPMQEFMFYHTWKHKIFSKLVYVVIQGGRCSLFFLLALPWVWKKLSVHGKRCIYWGLLALISYFCLFYFEVKVSHGMLVYPWVVLTAAHILQSLSNKYVTVALGAAIMIAPTLLTMREFQKLDMGQVKAEQQEVLTVLKGIIQKPGKAMVYHEECAEYKMGPQIWAEFPQLHPLNDVEQMPEADYIIMTTEYIALTEGGYSEFSYGSRSDLLFECISEMKSYGTGNYMIYAR